MSRGDGAVTPERWEGPAVSEQVVGRGHTDDDAALELVHQERARYGLH